MALLARCAELEPENAEVWSVTALARRALRDWRGALAAADKRSPRTSVVALEPKRARVTRVTAARRRRTSVRKVASR